MTEHYPVKKKGERRRLDPNWTAIAWLEADTLDDTQIIHTADLEGFSIPSVFADELNRIGEHAARAAERVSSLPDGSVTITFEVHDSITPVLGELSCMTYREWREENGIA